MVLEGVRRTYRLEGGEDLAALGGVDLELEGGSLVAICGASGSGKSTLLHVIGGLERPDAGRVVVGGRELMRLSRRELAGFRRRVGFVFQRFNLLPALTVLDNVVAPVLPLRTAFDKRRRAQELVSAVGLGGRERSLPSRLSGGQQQRVAIARALINDPQIVLADEPTGNLDSATGDEIIELLMGLRSERGVTVVVATHDVQLAARCDRMVALRDGQIVDDVRVTAEVDLQAVLLRPDPGVGS